MSTLLDWRVVLSGLIGICVAAGLVLGVEEVFWLRRNRRLDRRCWREMALSLSPLPVNIVVTLAATGVWTALYGAAQEYAVGHWPVNTATLLLAFLGVDFSYYWEHRCAHRLPWLWGLYHAIHHSSHDYTVATAYRVSCINQVLSPAFYLPWVLLGVPPLLVVALQLLAFHYQAWLHTEMIGSLGVLDAWFNTPANHRLHHSAALVHRDRNLGAITMLWDRLFGTYHAAAHGVCYGIPGAAPPTRFWQLYTGPWRQWIWPGRKRDDAPSPTAFAQPRQVRQVRMAPDEPRD